jgi:hypothetical protein
VAVVPAEAPVVVPEGVVVPVVAAVLEVAEGQAAVPVEIDKAQSQFNPKIEFGSHPSPNIAGSIPLAGLNGHNQIRICVSSSRSLSISLKSRAAADNTQFLFSLFPENPQEL